MTSTARRMSARLRNSRTSSQASSPVNLSPRVDDSAIGPNGTPKGFAAEKRVASPAADVCGPRRKSQRLASRSQRSQRTRSQRSDVLVENHGSEDGSGKSESSRSSGSDTFEDSGHEQPDERAQRLERRRAGTPASAAELKVEEQDSQRYPKRERIEISRPGPRSRAVVHVPPDDSVTTAIPGKGLGHGREELAKGCLSGETEGLADDDRPGRRELHARYNDTSEQQRREFAQWLRRNTAHYRFVFIDESGYNLYTTRI
ncbi:hypothetical protein FOZ63_033156 [Perkinsus olseni]|uniref:Uncharacterized protein n=1 Tax=Perkinsus olseni TaxID=32597 RepID=A0A7J6RTK2_PEROL|nr:hypothetical protein FOZ63_033156 [Perkinsus olseni]